MNDDTAPPTEQFPVISARSTLQERSKAARKGNASRRRMLAGRTPPPRFRDSGVPGEELRLLRHRLELSVDQISGQAGRRVSSLQRAEARPFVGRATYLLYAGAMEELLAARLADVRACLRSHGLRRQP
jgi:hypothetical protein